MADSPALSTIYSDTGVPFRVNSQYAGQFGAFLRALQAEGYKVKGGGGYNDRNIAGTAVPSYHALGDAIDINPQDNPEGSRGNLPPDIEALAKKYGLGWGGDWKSKKDPMHFSVAQSEGGSVAIPHGRGGTGVPDTNTASVAGLPPFLAQILAQGQLSPEEQATVKQRNQAAEESIAALRGAEPQLERTRQGLEADRQGLAANKVPDMPEIPNAQEMEKRELGKVSGQPGDPTRVLGQFLPTIAILGGLLAHKGSTAALQAATAAMNGAKANDAAAVEKAHKDFMAAMDQVKTTMEYQKTRFDEINEKYGQDKASWLAEQSVLAAETGNKLQQEAIRAGQVDDVYKYHQMGQEAYGRVAQMMMTQQNHLSEMDLRRAELAEHQQHDRFEEGHAQDTANPAYQAYHEAHDAAIKAGKSPEEAAKAGQDALRTTELAVHPTMSNLVGTREERLMNQDPVIKAARTQQNYINNIESLSPEDLQTGPGQTRLLDSFNRLATNQAIQQFLVHGATAYQGLADKARLALQQNLGQNGQPPTAPFLSPAQIKEYQRQGQEMVKEIKKVEGDRLAQHARNMEARGIDPAQGGITGDDLELAIQAGYKPDPKKWNLSQSGGGESGGDNRPAGIPADAQKAPDGHWYTKGDNGKYLDWGA